MNTTVTADAKFLRRVFLGLVMLTTLAGGMAAFTTVQAKTASGACVMFCE